MRVSFLFIAFVFCFLNLYSQELSGVVVDSKTNEPIEGASVYFDNTTIGTATNSQGEFTLTYNTLIKTPLIVSFLGYQKQAFNDFSNVDSLKIDLVEDVNALNEVYLSSKDSWSRDVKLKLFKRYFLGLTQNAQSCRILNEDDLILRYLEKQQQLVASSKKPLVIENKQLKYEVTYDLQDFELTYEMVSDSLQSLNQPRLFPTKAYYAGTSLFRELSQSGPSKSALKKREKVYNGSVVHFMRMLLKGKLNESGYRLLYNKHEVPPQNFFSIYKTEIPDLYQIRLFKPLIVIYENDIKNQSRIDTENGYFYLDAFGNHSPVDAVIFSGNFGEQRVGDMLPLDFKHDF